MAASENDPKINLDLRKETNPKDAAALSQGRVPLGLVPDTFIIATAMGMHEGDLKYGAYNFRIAGVRASIYNDALRRHMAAWWNGEDIDPDSGLPHLWKMASCLAVLIDAREAGLVTDDRPPRAPVGHLLNGLKVVVKDIEHRYAAGRAKRFTIADTPENKKAVE